MAKTTNKVLDLQQLRDELPAGPDATRAGLLKSARREVTTIRKTFVQKPPVAGDRGSVLADLVRERQVRAFDAYVLLLALGPILDGTPLPSEVWARALSPEDGPAASPAAMSKTWLTLESFNLVQRTTRIERRANVLPLKEDGSGAPYVRPGLIDRGTTGYFQVPNTYWTGGWAARLSLPAKAVLFILFSETTRKPTFAFSYFEVAKWYGISERTAERGVKELGTHNLIGMHGQRVATPRSPTGFTTRYHRYLRGPFEFQKIISARNRGRKAMASKGLIANASTPRSATRSPQETR